MALIMAYTLTITLLSMRVSIGEGSTIDKKQFSFSPGKLPSFSKCEPLRISLCKHLHYNQTIYPNLLHHRTQVDAEMDLYSYLPMAKTQCHKAVTHFLCVLFAPVCTILETAIPPCRSLCRDVQNGCIGLLQKFGFQWPQELNCNNFPESKSGQICIKLPGKPEKKSQSEWTSYEPKMNAAFDISCPKKMPMISIRKIRQSGKKCLTRSMKQLIMIKCQGKQQCRLNFMSYLSQKCQEEPIANFKIKYKCSKAPKPSRSHSLSLGQSMTLKCKKRREIRITMATFGDDKTCDTPDAYCRVSKRCNNNNTCVVSAQPKEFLSKCTTPQAVLQLKYDCIRQQDVPMAEVSVTGSRLMSIVCSSKRKIAISSVSHSGSGVKCRSDGVYCVVFALCNDKQRCVVPDLTFFQRQCAGSNPLQRLHVKYQCVSSQS